MATFRATSRTRTTPISPSPTAELDLAAAGQFGEIGGADCPTPLRLSVGAAAGGPLLRARCIRPGTMRFEIRARDRRLEPLGLRRGTVQRCNRLLRATAP